MTLIPMIRANRDPHGLMMEGHMMHIGYGHMMEGHMMHIGYGHMMEDMPDNDTCR